MSFRLVLKSMTLNDLERRNALHWPWKADALNEQILNLGYLLFRFYGAA